MLGRVAAVIVLASMVLACGQVSPGSPGGAASATTGTAAPAPARNRGLGRKDPPLLNDRIDRMGLGSPVTVSMAEEDDHGDPFPILAERLPSQTDGSWVVNADGTMRTTYRLRADLVWHDGVPLTAADFVFAHG